MSEKVSEIITRKMRELKIKGVDIQQQLGVSSGLVSQWRSGRQKPSGDHIFGLARILHLDPQVLRGNEATGKSLGAVDLSERIPLNKLPVISFVQAGEWREIIDAFAPGDADEWIYTSARVSNSSFGLRVVNDSMQNPYGGLSIPEGAIVIVDPEIQPVNGSIVVARLEDSVESTLKKLVIDGDKRYLKPLNPDYPIMPIEQECTIVGVVRKVEIDVLI